jgi:hypothetical protein
MNSTNNINDSIIYPDSTINDIYINNLTEQISHIIKSPNKNEFIKKYNECHDHIKRVDEILYKPSNLDPDINIKILFEMLKEYDILIESGDITISQYKNMCDLVTLIETKLKQVSIDIKEIS